MDRSAAIIPALGVPRQQVRLAEDQHRQADQGRRHDQQPGGDLGEEGEGPFPAATSELLLQGRHERGRQRALRQEAPEQVGQREGDIEGRDQPAGAKERERPAGPARGRETGKPRVRAETSPMFLSCFDTSWDQPAEIILGPRSGRARRGLGRSAGSLAFPARGLAAAGLPSAAAAWTPRPPPWFRRRRPSPRRLPWGRAVFL